MILSHALWQQLYGGDLSAIGRELRLGGTPFTIVGVMPRDFVFVNPEVRFWVPLAFTAEQKTQYHNNNWGHIGRLKPGATLAQVQAQINALNAANLERFPEWKDILINAGFYTRVEPLQHMLVKDVEGALYLLWGGAVFVLLIGGLNIANLALARWSVRGKEIATRLALGAGRAQLARQLIVENVLVAGAGGIAGVLLGIALLRAVAAIGLDRFPRAQEVRIDGTVILVSPRAGGRGGRAGGACADRQRFQSQPKRHAARRQPHRHERRPDPQVAPGSGRRRDWTGLRAFGRSGTAAGQLSPSACGRSGLHE